MDGRETLSWVEMPVPSVPAGASRALGPLAHLDVLSWAEIRFNEASEESPLLHPQVEGRQREPKAAAWAGVGNGVCTWAAKPHKVSLLMGAIAFNIRAKSWV